MSNIIDNKTIISLLSEYYGFEDTKINCFQSVEEFEEKSKPGRNVVLKKLSGDFPLWIDLYGFVETKDEEIATFFALNIDLEVLVSDESINPYHWILCTKTGKSLVSVNTEIFDEKDSFVIEKIISKL